MSRFVCAVSAILLATGLSFGSCPGDLNGDGSVDAIDLLALLSAWGPCADPRDCPGDLDGDGAVNVPDLLQMLNSWGGVSTNRFRPRRGAVPRSGRHHRSAAGLSDLGRFLDHGVGSEDRLRQLSPRAGAAVVGRADSLASPRGRE